MFGADVVLLLVMAERVEDVMERGYEGRRHASAKRTRQAAA